MAVTTDSFTEGRLTERLGHAPARRDGFYDLQGAHLARLSLTKAQLGGADLTQANLRGADLMRADLEDALLRGADLSEARLQQATLDGADLRHAILARAVLFDTSVYQTQLAGALLDGALCRDVALWQTDLIPPDVARLGELTFVRPLLALDPDDEDELGAALDWAATLGQDPERQALRQLYADRRWRRHRRDLRATLKALDEYLGPLGAASLSQAEAPMPLTPGSISRAAAPERRPGERSLSRLRARKEGLRHPDPPPPSPEEET